MKVYKKNWNKILGINIKMHQKLYKLLCLLIISFCYWICELSAYALYYFLLLLMKIPLIILPIINNYKKVSNSGDMWKSSKFNYNLAYTVQDIRLDDCLFFSENLPSLNIISLLSLFQNIYPLYRLETQNQYVKGFKKCKDIS